MKQRLVKTEVCRLISLAGGTIFFGVLYASLDFYCPESTIVDQRQAIKELMADGYVCLDGWNKASFV